MNVKPNGKIDEIRIRNVDAGSVARIDQLAKKKGVSRNEYLRKYIENLSVLNILKDTEERYTSTIKRITEAIDANTAEIRMLRSELERNKKNGKD